MKPSERIEGLAPALRDLLEAQDNYKLERFRGDAEIMCRVYAVVQYLDEQHELSTRRYNLTLLLILLCEARGNEGGRVTVQQAGPLAANAGLAVTFEFGEDADRARERVISAAREKGLL